MRSTTAERLPLLDGLLEVWRTGRSGDILVPNLTHLVGYLPHIHLHALSASLASLVEQHDILTAIVEEAPGETYLSLDERFTPQLEVVDLRDSNPDGEAEILERRAKEMAADRVWRAFDFDAQTGRSGPLLRAFLIVISEDRSVLGIVVHHLIADHLSMAIVGRDLSRFYEQHVRGRVPRRPQPSVNFIDHTRNFETWLASPAGKGAAEYWRTKAAKELPILMIPPDADASGSARLDFTFPPELSRAMRKFARIRKIKCFTLCLAAQLLAIVRASGEKEGLIYIDHFGRDQARLFNVVGCFAWAVPARLSVYGTRTLEQVVSKVQRECDDLFSTTPVPVHKLDPLGLGGGSWFNFVDCSPDINGALFSTPLTIPLPDTLSVQKAPSHHGLIIERMTTGLRGSVIYSNYSEDRMRAYVTDMLTLLAEAINAPDQDLDCLWASCGLPQNRRCFEMVFH